MSRVLVAVVLFVLAPLPAWAELIDLTVYRREPFAGGQTFGDVGAYEKLVGVARFAIDPAHERNKPIVDLDLAPRNKDDRVEFEADVYMLAPKDRSKGNGAILYDVNNRGNKLALGMFNAGASGNNDPATADHVGDGFLFRRGYTLVWCGWITELLPGNNRLLLKAPQALENNKPIRGVVRFETTVDAAAESAPLSRRDGHGSFPPTIKGEREGVLTWRMRETDARVVIPREQWSLERMPMAEVKQGVAGTLPQIKLKVAGGLRPGYLYELICECEGSVVQGCGFAAVRDLISFLKYSQEKTNPLRSDDGRLAVSRAHGFGVSQSGRFLRHFLYEGFNADEKDRKVFDGLMPHVAGGGLGFFNHRFAQPTRHNGQHEEHSYPADVYPFTYGPSPRKEPSGVLISPDEKTILNRSNTVAKPKVMHTQSSAEYWHRSGSLVHTNPKGEYDADLPYEVRLYAFGGTQHGPAADPPKPGLGDNLPNPADYRPFLRALLTALDAWTKEEGPGPPASVYPTIADKTLVDWSQEATGFPALPGVRYPEVIQQPPMADFGELFKTRKIITQEPPRINGHYVVKVPRCDHDGIDMGCLLPPEVAVPLATYTGWNLRKREAGAEGMLWSLQGSYIPFAKTAEERKKTGDPRLSIAERYPTFEAYRDKYAAACADLVRKSYLLQEDADRLIKKQDRLKEGWPK